MTRQRLTPDRGHDKGQERGGERHGHRQRHIGSREEADDIGRRARRTTGHEDQPNGEARIEIEHAAQRPAGERHDRIVRQESERERAGHPEQAAKVFHRESEPHAQHHDHQRPRDQWPGEPRKGRRAPKRQRCTEHQPHRIQAGEDLERALKHRIAGGIVNVREHGASRAAAAICPIMAAGEALPNRHRPDAGCRHSRNGAIACPC